MKRLLTNHGVLSLPSFLPDATRAVVKSLDASDLTECGVKGLVVNTLHLSSHPGTSLISKQGGVHQFMGWDGPIISDSGGYQVYSLISESPKSGGITSRGFTYRLGGGDKKVLTPENCIQKQCQIGSDILVCLDHCTHPDDPRGLQETSVNNTIEWARRCKAAFQKRMDQNPPDRSPPLIFAVVQGGADPDLRRSCFERLLEIGFDGYGYGGWPIDSKGRLLDMLEFVAGLIPNEFPKHALGVGKPENLVRAFTMGYNLFDCAIPTRDARHKRLYVFNEGSDYENLDRDSFFHPFFISDKRYVRDGRPIDERCKCPCCRRYSRSYLHHLFKIRDSLAPRLATMHNLTFYTELLKRLAKSQKPEGSKRQL